MTVTENYHALALAQRQAAAETNLPNRRAMHERSASTWEEMAASVAETASKAAINLAAKRNR